LFGSTAVPVEVPKKKRSLLPLLTVLFLFSYGLMTMLIVEQGSVIQSQRNLIKVLLGDSTELWSMKGKAIADQRAGRGQAQSRAQTPSAQIPFVQTPSSQVPSIQTPANQIPANQVPSIQTPATQIQSNQVPSNQAAPQRRSQSYTGKIARPQTQVPPMPASDLADQRRALRTI